MRAVDHVQKIKLFYYRIDNIQNLLTGAVPRAKIVGTLSNQVIKFVQKTKNASFDGSITKLSKIIFCQKLDLTFRVCK